MANKNKQQSTVTDASENVPESPANASQSLDDSANEVIEVESEVDQYESLYETVVMSLGAGGKSSVLGMSSITGLLQKEWKQLTPAQQKEFHRRIERLTAMAQELLSNVKEYSIYSGAR